MSRCLKRKSTSTSTQTNDGLYMMWLGSDGRHVSVVRRRETIYDTSFSYRKRDENISCRVEIVEF